MKILDVAICVLGLSVLGRGQEDKRPSTMTRLSQSAEQELAKSTEELRALREQIANEKLPLAQELTASEEKVVQLRKEHERITRLVDEGNLDVTNIKVEMKARQDELSYIGNLFDEYARGFESKVNIAELQYCGAPAQAAKEAVEDKALTASERFGKQLAFVDVSIKRLFDVIGGLRFPGIAVDLEGSVLDGQFAILGPVALFRASTGVSGLVVPQTNSTKPLIRPLEGAMQAGLASLVETGEGNLPLDPTRGGALKALVQKTNILHIFKKGGPIMYPLLLASILALGTVIERLFFLARERSRRDPNALEQFFAAVARGDLAEALLRGVGRALATPLEEDVLQDQDREQRDGQQAEDHVGGQHPGGRRHDQHDGADRVGDRRQHLGRRLRIHTGVGDQLPRRVGAVPAVGLVLVAIDDLLPQGAEHPVLRAPRPDPAHHDAHRPHKADGDDHRGARDHGARRHVTVVEARDDHLVRDPTHRPGRGHGGQREHGGTGHGDREGAEVQAHLGRDHPDPSPALPGRARGRVDEIGRSGHWNVSTSGSIFRLCD